METDTATEAETAGAVATDMTETDGAGAVAGDDAGSTAGEEQEAQGAGLPPEVQVKIDRRIGKITAKQKAAEEAATAATAERDAALSKLKETEGRKDAEFAAQAVKLGIHPDYLTPEQTTLLQRYDGLQADEQWLSEHVAEGYEASGRGHDLRSLTATEVATELVKVQRELRALAPNAEGVKQSRREEMLRHMRLGREAEKAGWKPGQKLAAATKPATETPKPPVRPGQAASAAAPVPPATVLKRFDAKALAEAGGGRTGLRKLYED